MHNVFEETKRYREALSLRQHCVYLNEVDSTNTRAKELARDGVPNGTSVFAERQTAGRGRLSRSWMSEPGCGIYMSYITRPFSLPAQHAPELSFLASLAVCDAFDAELQRSGVSQRSGIKWPNDVILSGKKASGILAETGLHPDGHVDWVVIGIGMNIFGTEFPADLPWATSLEAIGCSPDRGAIALCLLERLDFWTHIWKQEGFSPIRLACKKRMLTLDRRVRAERDGEVCIGTAIDLDEDGSLLLQADDGSMLSLRFGEVSVRGMMGYI